MAGRIVVTGVGMIPFREPGASASYVVMGAQAARLALADARVGYESVQQAFASYVHGDSTSGQRVLYDIGLTRIPIFNVHNGGASGATALWLARQAIASGEAEIALALGFEQIGAGDALAGGADLPPAARIAGAAGLEHMKRFGTPLETFAKIRAKAGRHALNNPFALLHQPVTPQEVLADPPLWPGVMTRRMAAPPAWGAAAAVLCSEDYAKRHALDARVWIAGQALATEGADAFASGDPRDAAGWRMSSAAAKQVFEAAGIGASEVDVVELHDGFAQDELLGYEALGLCPEGEGQRLVDDGDNSYGGRYVVNPSGGLLCRGEAAGATGLAQCFELVRQLRGQAGKRQVQGARIALQHNASVGAAAVVTMYRN